MALITFFETVSGALYSGCFLLFYPNYQSDPTTNQQKRITLFGKGKAPLKTGRASYNIRDCFDCMNRAWAPILFLVLPVVAAVSVAGAKYKENKNQEDDKTAAATESAKSVTH
jgi:hypothetical protein